MADKTRLPPTPTLLLGTFHFDDAGRDRYKPQGRFDVAARQTEILDVVERLAAFEPTKIAVEFDALQQQAVNRDYGAFLRGDFELPGGEAYQLGFRLAQRLGHERVYATNAWGRFYDPPRDLDLEDALTVQGEPFDTHDALETYARKHDQMHLLGQWTEDYLARFTALDEEKTQQSVRKTLRELNRPQTILEWHSVYLVDHFKVGVGHEYPGVDAVTAWYNRNLRIFANLQRVTEAPDERLLIVYGVGHTAILRGCLGASPEYELVEVSAYL